MKIFKKNFFWTIQFKSSTSLSLFFVVIFSLFYKELSFVYFNKEWERNEKKKTSKRVLKHIDSIKIIGTHFFSF